MTERIRSLRSHSRNVLGETSGERRIVTHAVR